ncbi:hypothetical protein [Streptomyces sp. NPDC058701]|uniref:hypothetical protein n=1 Tax=Streptomyces sp. NPDC058701 TaxID=3346608 RepID=UPI00364A6576
MSTKVLIDLNSGTLNVYDMALMNYKKRILESRPILLALFNGGGGKMILYDPSGVQREAPPVPFAYRSLKAVAHVPLGVYAAFIDTQSDEGALGLQALERLDAAASKPS